MKALVKSQTILKLAFLVTLGLCPQLILAETNKLDANVHALKDTSKSYFKSDVIGVDEPMLYPSYWKSRLESSDSVILEQLTIAANNQKLINSNHLMNDLSNYPEVLTGSAIKRSINKISKPARSKRFYSTGELVSSADYNEYKEALNLETLSGSKKIVFGMVVRRSDMRTFPTTDKIYKTATSINLDRFQETALFPTQVVAILHESKDKQWYFVVSYNYSAWIQKSDVATGDRSIINHYKDNTNFLVVTGSKITTSYNPENAELSELQLEMGTVLPLTPSEDIPTTIGGQNTYTSYVVKLPTRKTDGTLIFKNALISRSDDVHHGFLPYTEANILDQSFKFLGERYGWGHSFNARDCTGFVGEVYKSFGILMPRNSGDQGNSQQGENAHFLKAATKKEKLAYMSQLEVGDLIYIPGHVMMVVGFNDDKPYIIHDVSGLSYFKKDGSYYKSKLNGVSMTPLLPMQLSPKKSYLDKIYNIKKIK